MGICVLVEHNNLLLSTLLDSLNISVEGISTYTSPYQSGVNIDSIPCLDMAPSECDRLWLQYQFPNKT